MDSTTEKVNKSYNNHKLPEFTLVLFVFYNHKTAVDIGSMTIKQKKKIKNRM